MPGDLTLIGMRVSRVSLHTVRLPLVAPFTTSFGTETERLTTLVEVTAVDGTTEATGWGECVALPEPVYSAEHLDGCVEVMRRWLLPPLAGRDVTAEEFAGLTSPIKGNRMAKAAVEMALLDAQLRLAEQSFGEYLGIERDRVPSGVSVGIQPSVDEMVRVVAGYRDEGYVRIKLKIKPGADIEPVRAVRQLLGDEALLQVDANTAYTLADADHLAGLDPFGLLLIEQPLGEEDLRQHAELAKRIATPVCLDESVVSLDAAEDAIELGAAAVINIKPGRVGGYLEAVRIHDLARSRNVPVWCGGMLETGIGRAANAALAALPGFTLPGDVSASTRFYATDITEPLLLVDGHLPVPTGPGFGVEPLPDVLARFRVAHETITLDVL